MTGLKCVTIIFVAGGICVTVWCYRSGILKKLNSVEMKPLNLLNQILIQGLAGEVEKVKDIKHYSTEGNKRTDIAN